MRLATRRQIEFYVAAKNDVLTELRRLARASEAANAAFVDEAAVEEAVAEEDDSRPTTASDAPLVRLVNSIIFQAAEEGASDIHVEPQEHDLIVRYRIDGVLHVAQTIPKRLTAGVTTRLKVLAKLDIAERRKPQDGRITHCGLGRPPARHPRRDVADGRRGRDGDDAPARQVARGPTPSLSASRTRCASSSRGSSPARRARCS